MLLLVKSWQRTRLSWALIRSSVSGVVAVSAKSAVPPVACLPVGLADSGVCAPWKALWSMAPACAVLKACSTTAPPRMMRITVLTGHAPVLQPTPVPAGAPWGCWHSACPASAATPLPGCALPCASVLTTVPHDPAAGATTPTLCAARFPPPTLTLIPRSVARPWRSRYDRPGWGPGKSISP